MKKHVFVWTGTRDKEITDFKYVAQAMVLLKGLLGITQHSIRERIQERDQIGLYFLTDYVDVSQNKAIQ
jgi:hypothetical protein